MQKWRVPGKPNKPHTQPFFLLQWAQPFHLQLEVMGFALRALPCGRHQNINLCKKKVCAFLFKTEETGVKIQTCLCMLYVLPWKQIQNYEVIHPWRCLQMVLGHGLNKSFIKMAGKVNKPSKQKQNALLKKSRKNVITVWFIIFRSKNQSN